MKLIPALDLKNHKIVTSSSGNKREYQEISSKLAPSADPLRFLEYILSLHDFNTIYLADLDSIEEFKAENFLISEILQEHKDITFIIDNGVRLYSQLDTYKHNNYIQIIATETFKEYQLIINEKYNSYILSVDIINKKIISKNNQYKKLSPEKIILMEIDNIGKKTGINNKNINILRNIFPSSKVMLAGGVSGNKDIFEAKKKEISEIILLTALLENKINYENILF